MLVLGISGSPRQNSNSSILLNAALEPFAQEGWEVLTFSLARKQIAPCTGCDFCQKENVCAISDDMAEVLAAYKKCDAIVIAAPVYYCNVPAQLKALFDRTYAAGSNPLQGKLGGAIAVGRGMGTGQSMVLSVIYNYYLSCGALCVPGELNGVHAVAGEPGDISSQPNRLRQAAVLGQNILRYAGSKN